MVGAGKFQRSTDEIDEPEIRLPSPATFISDSPPERRVLDASITCDGSSAWHDGELVLILQAQDDQTKRSVLVRGRHACATLIPAVQFPVAKGTSNRAHRAVHAIFSQCTAACRRLGRLRTRRVLRDVMSRGHIKPVTVTDQTGPADEDGTLKFAE